MDDNLRLAVIQFAVTVFCLKLDPLRPFRETFLAGRTRLKLALRDGLPDSVQSNGQYNWASFNIALRGIYWSIGFGSGVFITAVNLPYYMFRLSLQADSRKPLAPPRNKYSPKSVFFVFWDL